MTEPKRPNLWPVVGFTLAYLAASVIGAVTRGNLEFIIYIAVMVAMIAAVGYVHFRVTFSAGVLWALSVWGLLHMAGGLVPVPESWPINGNVRVLYSLWIIPDRLKYDHLVHAYGFGVTTWACWQALRAAIARRCKQPVLDVKPSWGLLALCMAAGMGFGAGNEVIEFAATLAVPETNVGGYENTGWDLVSNFVGTAIAALMIWFGARTAR